MKERTDGIRGIGNNHVVLRLVFAHELEAITDVQGQLSGGRGR